jgi:hypothetical protein
MEQLDTRLAIVLLGQSRTANMARYALGPRTGDAARERIGMRTR